MSVHEVDCLLESMDSVVDLLGQLEDSQWRVPSLCPAWQVRHVVAHLDGIEKALTGWRLSGDTPAPFDIVGNVFDEANDWPPDRLLGRFRTVLTSGATNCSPWMRPYSTRCRRPRWASARRRGQFRGRSTSWTIEEAHWAVAHQLSDATVRGPVVLTVSFAMTCSTALTRARCVRA